MILWWWECTRFFFLLFYLPHYSVLTVTANIHDKGDKKKKKWNEIQKRKKKNTQHNKEFINTKTKTKNHNQNETKRNQPSKCSILAWAHTCIHRRRNIHTAHYGTVRHSTVQHQHSTAQHSSASKLVWLWDRVKFMYRILWGKENRDTNE